MSWQDCRLGDLLTLKRGHDLPEKRRVDGPVPIVSSSGITGYHKEAKAQAPGVVTGRYGTLGEVYFIDQAYWPLNTALYVVDFKDTHPRFAAYFLKNALRNYQSDKAAVPGVDRNVLHELKVRAPDFPVQEAIASILSAYDDLIENNRRRMALLEEAARQLYREWFVRLRFPGYEHTRIIDGVPEGWKRNRLEEVCIAKNGIQTGPFGSQLHQSDYSDSGVPVVMPKDLADFRVDTDNIARVPDEIAARLQRHRLCAGDTIYGRRGDIGRRAYIGDRQAGFLCGTGSLRIRPDSALVNPRYLYDTLGAPETAGTIANRAKGATMLNLNQKVLKTVPLLIAPRRLQDMYVEQAQDVAAQCDVLLEINQRLRKAREILLPRLMSGQIAV